MPESLTPFLNPTFFFEILVVGLVSAYIIRRYFTERNKLDSLAESLGAEGGALAAAESLLANARDEKRPMEWRATALKNSLLEGTLVYKRAQLIERNGSRLPETALSRTMIQTTDEARFWTGAFTFIGLIGTLLCLGAAVFFLMLIVGRSGSGANLTSGLKEVVTHMVAVFGSMGAAFLSTASGVGATVKLAGKIAQVERNWEDLRVRLEDFSLFELEPLAAAVNSKGKDLSSLEALVKTMEGVATQFTEALNTTVETVRNLQDSNEALNDKLQSAAGTLDEAATHFASSTKGFSNKIASLTSVFERHEAAQIEWGQSNANTITWLNDAVKGSLETFERLDGLRADMLKDSSVLRAEMHDSLQSINALAQSIGTTSQQQLYQLRDEINRGLQMIRESIDAGTQSEERLLRQFESILGQMGEYAAHVEGTLNQLPGAMGAEPLFLMEDNQSKILNQVGDGLGQVRGEIVGLRSDVKDSLGGAIRGAMKETTGKITEVGAKVDAVGGQFKAMSSSADGVRQLQSDLGGLTVQVQNMESQMRQINGIVGRLDRSFVIRLGGKG